MRDLTVGMAVLGELGIPVTVEGCEMVQDSLAQYPEATAADLIGQLAGNPGRIEVMVLSMRQGIKRKRLRREGGDA